MEGYLTLPDKLRLSLTCRILCITLHQLPPDPLADEDDDIDDEDGRRHRHRILPPMDFAANLWRSVRFPAVTTPPDTAVASPWSLVQFDHYRSALNSSARRAATRLPAELAAPFWTAHVHDVSLKAAAWLTPAHLRIIITSCPQLQSLDLRDCPQLSNCFTAVLLDRSEPPELDPSKPVSEWSCTHEYDPVTGKELIRKDLLAAAEGKATAGSDSDSEDGSDSDDLYDSTSSSEGDKPAPPKVHIFADDDCCARCKYVYPRKPVIVPPPRRIYLYASKNRKPEPPPPPPVIPDPKPLLPHMRCLKLDWSEAVDADLIAIAISCPSLTAISLFRCTAITDAGLGYVARYCRQLAMIDVAGCGKVTDISVAVRI